MRVIQEAKKKRWPIEPHFRESKQTGSKVEGRTRLTYVRKRDVDAVRAQTDAWRQFSQAMAQWVQGNQDLQTALRELGRAPLVLTPRSARHGS